MKIPKLDLWIAVDRKFFTINGGKKIKSSSYIFNKRPKKFKNITEHLEVIFDFEDNGLAGSYSRIFSAKLLGLENDSKCRKLYVLKKRHKKSIRTFWLGLLGYKKYVLTSMFPIKLDYKNEEESYIYESIRIQEDPKQIVLLHDINNYHCGQDGFNIYEKHCNNCSKFTYCHNLYLKHSISYEKIYLYFIKNGERVYL